MARKHFVGKSLFAKAEWAFDKRIMSREWFTYKEVEEEVRTVKDSDKNKSKEVVYRELKRAFIELRKILKDKYGDDFIEEEGKKIGDIDTRAKSITLFLTLKMPK